MKNQSYLLLIILSTILVLSGCSSTSMNYRDIEVPPVEWSPPEFKEFDLPNGIAGLIVEDHEVPLVDFYLSFPSPSDPADKVGLASMTGWALRNGGSVNIPADSLNYLVEFKAASIGVSAGQEQLQVYGFCLKDDLGLLLEIARDLIDNPAYPEDKIEFRRSNMLEGIRRSNDNPRGIGSREIYKLLYPDHPWGRENSTTTVNAISRDDIMNYHNQVFQTEGAVFGVVGDITLEEAKELTSKHFGDFKGGDVAIEPLPKAGEAAKPGIYYAYKDVTQAYVYAGHRTITYDDPRSHAAQIMNYILGSGMQSILSKRIRVDEGLAYGTGSRFSAPVPIEGTFTAFASTRLAEAGRTLGLMNEVISDYAENGPTQEQFDQALKAYVNSYVWKYESSEDMLYRLVYLKWRGLPLDSPQRDLEAYQNLTIEDVKQAAKELLHPDNMIKVVVGDKDQLDQPLESFGEVIELDISTE
ncbi:MAG: insulinase family protein [Calditrichaeota bacterium]|nr:insulinase family protein [Calditrichota bacterium]MBT7618350.1 insulinase family protein [Calditrichota bacterium]